MTRRALARLAIVAVALCDVACEPTPGTPITDTGDPYADVEFPRVDAARDTTPVDLGLYDAPVVEGGDGGNCVVYRPSGDRIAVECEPGTTCDVSSIDPLCARNVDAGVHCGSVGCVGGYSCGPDGGPPCIGIFD